MYKLLVHISIEFLSVAKTDRGVEVEHKTFQCTRTKEGTSGAQKEVSALEAME